MRVALALAATVSAQLDWSDDLREIHAIGIQNQWLVEKLAPSALFGRHERRLRRQADDCQDNHPRCDEYAEYCDNVQFATTCAASCNTCDTSSSEPEMNAMREGPLQFSVPECEGRKSCFRSPPDCWLEDPGCMFVSWRRDDATGQIYTFEVSGNIGQMDSGWVGFGFSLDERMGNDDLYFCEHFNGMSRFKSAMSYGRAPPKMLPMTHIISHAADFKRGVLQCRFQRKAAIEKSIGKDGAMMFDLNQDNFYLLVAWGSIGGGGIPLHHKGRTLTSKPVDFAYPPTAIEIMDGKASIDHLTPGKKRDSQPPSIGFSFPSPVKDYSNEVDLAQQKMIDDMKQSPLFKYLQENACVDASMACSGVTELCQKDDFRDTLETYCKQTCGFCSADADAAGDGDDASGACENKYPNCDQLQFMCEEEQYKGPFIKMCPITCGVCEGDGSAPAATSEPAGPTKCEDTAEHCGSLSSYCDKPETKDMMAQQCALTCGFCQAEGSENDPAAAATEAPAQEQTPEDACVDTPGTDCQKYLLYCDNTNTQIPKVCKKSCGHCGADAPAKQATTTQKPATTTTTAAPTTTKAPTTKASTTIATTMADSECAPVKDKSTKCSSYKKFCQNPKYKAKLASQCPATCNVCVKSKPEAKAPASTGAVCKDNVPAQCPKMKRYCGSAKYEKVLKQKCSLTCGFCTADGSAPTQAPAASEKFGKWSVSWSKCNSKCKQYKARKCLQAPCPKTQLYQFRDCPAEENQNIPACSSSGAAKPAAKTCSNRAGANFCSKHSAKCTSKKPKELQVMKQMCQKECAICT